MEPLHGGAAFVARGARDVGAQVTVRQAHVELHAVGKAKAHAETHAQGLAVAHAAALLGIA